jgi:hypothetical protein
MALHLWDYSGRNRVWSLDAETGDYRWTHGCSGATSGVATELWAGLLAPKRTFVALYPESGRIVLRVASETVDLQEPTLQISKTACIPFARRARVRVGGTLRVDLRWWAVLADGDPWTGDDILDYVVEQFASPDAVASFARYWADTGKSLLDRQFGKRGSRIASP